jgi:hypothetical protein
MADKIIEFDVSKRLSKEAFQNAITMVNDLKFDQTKGFVVITSDEEGDISVVTYGLEWGMIGRSRALMDVFAQNLLSEEGIIDESH